jgi:hypothetical protein
VTDALFFYEFYFGGHPDEEEVRRYERCDLVGFIKEWGTPQLVVHAEGNERCRLRRFAWGVGWRGLGVERDN